MSAAVITLLLIMDPIGNIPPFLSILKSVPVERRRLVLLREILLAYGCCWCSCSSASISCVSFDSNKRR